MGLIFILGVALTRIAKLNLANTFIVKFMYAELKILFLSLTSGRFKFHKINLWIETNKKTLNYHIFIWSLVH